MHHRIHILGGSGSGTTTLGNALSLALKIPHFDTDDYFWDHTTLLPYSQKRSTKEREDLLRNALENSPNWILSGSLCGWGDFAIPFFTRVVFLWLPSEIRMQRLKNREIERYGIEALTPGGWFHDHHLEFMEWAQSYDSPDTSNRSRKLHEKWMAQLPCPVQRFEKPYQTQELVTFITIEIAGLESK